MQNEKILVIDGAGHPIGFVRAPSSLCDHYFRYLALRPLPPLDTAADIADFL